MLSACRLQAAGKARRHVSGHANLSRGGSCCLLPMAYGGGGGPGGVGAEWGWSGGGAGSAEEGERLGKKFIDCCRYFAVMLGAQRCAILLCSM